MEGKTTTRSPIPGVLALLLLACDPEPPTEVGFGRSFAVVPDIDRDGVADVVAAIPLYTYSRDGRTRFNAGGMCVISGRTGATHSCHDGPNGGALFGASIIALDTPSGHGRLVVCAPGEVARGSDGIGMCRVLEPEWLNEVGAVQVASGLAVRLGDITGDGFEDFGMKTADRHRWVVASGAEGTVLTEIVLEENHEYAHALTGLGADTDGDGIGDLASTTYRTDTESFSLAIHSGETGAVLGSCSPEDITHFGFSLATVTSDVDTGANQLPRVVSSMLEDPTSNRISLALLDPITCAVITRGETLLPPSNEDGQFGETLGEIHDVNGDAVRDLVRTSTCHKGCTGSRVDVISGKTLTVLKSRESLFDGTRRQVVSVADFNRDGVPDFVWNAKSGEREVLQVIDGVSLTILLERGFDDQNWRWRDQ